MTIEVIEPNFKTSRTFDLGKDPDVARCHACYFSNLIATECLTYTEAEDLKKMANLEELEERPVVFTVYGVIVPILNAVLFNPESTKLSRPWPQSLLEFIRYITGF